MRLRRYQKIAGRSCCVICWPTSAEKTSTSRTWVSLDSVIRSLTSSTWFCEGWSLPPPSGRAEYNLTIGSTIFQTWELKWLDLMGVIGCLSGKNRYFPGGLDGKASVYNAGDPGSIPGLGRSPGEGNGNPLQLGKSHGRSPWVCKESDMTEQLHFHWQNDCHSQRW